MGGLPEVPKTKTGNQYLDVTRDDLQKETINMLSPRQRRGSAKGGNDSERSFDRQSDRNSNYASRAG